MKYSGNLFGFLSSSGSIYNVQTQDSKCYLWKANVVAESIANGMVIKYTWNGDVYELRIREIKPNYFTGDIFSEGEVWGGVYLWKYQKENEMLLRGDYNEDGIDYNVFVELRPLD